MATSRYRSSSGVAALLAFQLLFCGATGRAAAQSDLAVIPASAAAGTVARVQIAAGAGFHAAGVSLTLDFSAPQPSGAPALALSPGDTPVAGPVFTHSRTVANTSVSGKLTIDIAGDSPANGPGVVADVPILVPATAAPGTVYPIHLSASLWDAAGAMLPAPLAQDGTLTVSAAGQPAGTVLSLLPATGQPGSVVHLQVMTTGGAYAGARIILGLAAPVGVPALALTKTTDVQAGPVLLQPLVAAADRKTEVEADVVGKGTAAASGVLLDVPVQVPAGAKIGAIYHIGLQAWLYDASGALLPAPQLVAGTLSIPALPAAGVGPAVTVTPDAGGNSGSVGVDLTGTGFQPGATVKLIHQGQPDILASGVSVTQAGTNLQATLNLQGQPAGTRDVVITNPDGGILTIARGFSIQAGRQAQLWANVVGPPVLIVGRPARFFVAYGNRGRTDAYGVSLILEFSQFLKATVKNQLAEPQPGPGQPMIDVSAVPLDVANGDNSMVTLYLPRISAGVTNVLTIESVVVPGTAHGLTFRVSADITHPLFQAPPPSAQSGAPPQFTPFGDQFVTDLTQILQTDQHVPVTRDAAGAALAHAVAADRLPSDQLTSLPALLTAVTQEATAELRRNPAGIRRAMKHYNGPSGNGFNDAANSLLDIIDPSGGGSNSGGTGGSVDPNDKLGVTGFGMAHFISGQIPLQYAIDFENLATATAPAQTVTVTDQLDAAHLDLSTFSFGPISFGDQQIVPITNNSTLLAQVDLRPTANLLVRIQGSLDQNTGLLTWQFTSLDPGTAKLTTDPLAGFLPPNKTPPAGQGSVFYTVMPKAGIPTGTIISNQAKVVFDVNAPINTPTWMNTLDNDKPVSHVTALPAMESASSFTVSWSGTDVGSGIQDYTILVSTDGGPFQPWLSNTTQTSASYPGNAGHSYAFISQARDNTSNLEGQRATADTTTTVSGKAAQRGDINGDAHVNALDALLELRFITGLQQPTAAQRTAGDVNGDGKLDIQDALLLLRLVVGLPLG